MTPLTDAPDLVQIWAAELSKRGFLVRDSHDEVHEKLTGQPLYLATYERMRTDWWYPIPRTSQVLIESTSDDFKMSLWIRDKKRFTFSDLPVLDAILEIAAMCKTYNEFSAAMLKLSNTLTK